MGRPSQSSASAASALRTWRGVGPLEFLEHLAQLLDAERLAVSQQCRLDDALELSGFHGYSVRPS